MKEIISAGRGGQGVLTTGLIISQIAMDRGDKVTWVPTYGSQMRGGPASCGIKVHPSVEIPSPFVKDIDILIAMSGDAVETNEENMKENGIIIVDSAMIGDRVYRSDLKVYELPITDIANELGNPKGANLVSLGAFVKVTDIFEKEEFADGIDKYFEKRNIKNEKNRECFLKGFEAVEK